MLFKQIYTGGDGEQLIFKVSEGNLSNPAIFDIVLPFSLESDTNVNNMLDSFSLDYTSDFLSPNMWVGGSY